MQMVDMGGNDGGCEGQKGSETREASGCRGSHGARSVPNSEGEVMDGGPVSTYEDVGVRHKTIDEVGLNGAGSGGRSGARRVHGMNGKVCRLSFPDACECGWEKGGSKL